MTDSLNITYNTLDINDINSLGDYESSMYRAFSGTEIQTLDRIWNIDHKKRKIKTKIPYESQKIYVARLEGKIVSGVAINVNMNDTLQLEMMGFTIDKDDKTAEGLGVFNLSVLTSFNPVVILLKNHAFEVVTKLGIEKMYGTCSEKKLRGYRILGWEPIDDRLFLGEKKYLLRIPLGSKQ